MHFPFFELSIIIIRDINNKIIIHHINVVTKSPELLQFIHFQEIFHKNSQIIYLYCFSLYQKKLCIIFLLWIYPLKLTNACLFKAGMFVLEWAVLLFWLSSFTIWVYCLACVVRGQVLELHAVTEKQELIFSAGMLNLYMFLCPYFKGEFRFALVWCPYGQRTIGNGNFYSFLSLRGYIKSLCFLCPYFKGDLDLPLSVCPYGRKKNIGNGDFYSFLLLLGYFNSCWVHQLQNNSAGT